MNMLGVLSAYECGLEPVGDARMKFEILYYVIGILYLIFDLEIMLPPSPTHRLGVTDSGSLCSLLLLCVV
jgi:NADH:ubiquinone oxidoreductase subunit 3 (subunit A)